jgi:hypothetical protein
MEKLKIFLTEMAALAKIAAPKALQRRELVLG